MSLCCIFLFFIASSSPTEPPSSSRISLTKQTRLKESFRGLRWAPLRPEHIDYVNSHLLLVGESRGTDSVLTDDHAGRELSAELDELADDDINRMRRLGSTEAEAVFASLHAQDQAEGQPELAKTFG